MTKLLTVHLGDAEQLVLSAVHETDGERFAMRCPCGGQWAMTWVTHDDGRPIHAYEAAVLLHTAPVCAPFQRLDWRAFHSYACTGVEPERRPTIPMAHYEHQPPARAAKPHHR